MVSDEIAPITPVNFFQLGIDCKSMPKGKSYPVMDAKNYKGFLLPDTSELCFQEKFADIALAWGLEGLEIFAKIDSSLQQVFYPEVERGDSFEVFIDTRDVKTATFNTKFCHHFFFLPEAVEGKMAGEITRFRTEDVHAHCDPDELKVKAAKQRTGYALSIFIPSSCLHGYQPDQFKRLGFSYRVNRYQDEPQHFSVVTSDYQIDQQPSLWASLNLT